MIDIEYRLTSENFKELNSYMALHDRKIQKKLLFLIVSLCIFCICLMLIIFKLSLITLLGMAICCAIVIKLFPNFFWKIEFKRLDQLVDNSKIKYSKMKVQITSKILVKSNKEIVILFSDIEKIDFTKHNCMIFYKDKQKTNVLIIPIEVLNEEKISQIYKLVRNEG